LNVVGSTYKLYRNVNKIAGKKYLKKNRKRRRRRRRRRSLYNMSLGPFLTKNTGLSTMF
jgi:hypothetical protein